MVHGFVWRMTSRRTKISPESGRGLGHVTPTIFGSTVGYPSEAWLLVCVGAPVHRGDRRTLGDEWRLTGAKVCVITKSATLISAHFNISPHYYFVCVQNQITVSLCLTIAI